MATDFSAELKKNREEKLDASKKKEKKEKRKGEIWKFGTSLVHLEKCAFKWKEGEEER